MTKAQLIRELSRKTGVEKNQVEAIVESFMKVVADQVCDKQTISLRGFGIFMPKKRAAKIGRNISKNTPMLVPAHYIPFFKPYEKFSDKVKKALSK